MSGQRVRGCLAGVVAAACLLAPASAQAEVHSSALGIPCAEQGANGPQLCEGDLAHRVHTWDGVPLDTNVVLPPASVDAPYPLIVFLHGWGDSKHGLSENFEQLAESGFAVLSYTARGFGDSCGNPTSRADPGCAEGWIHLADARYEGRDAQTLAGKLVDEGLAEAEIGVTGVSYGGGQSMLLATLKDRMMLPDGTLVDWQSPEGTPMSVAGAVPVIPWSDLAESLTPNGRKLDYETDPSYGSRVGIAKESYITTLYSIGQANFYAPPGADPEADITRWYLRIQQGEPYDDDPEAGFLLDQIRRFHSALYLEDSIPPADREQPAPLLIYNGFTDDLFPAEEALTYANKQRARHPGSEIGLFFAAEGGHPRADVTAVTGEGFDAAVGLAPRYYEFWDRHLKGIPGTPLGVETRTQNCGDSTTVTTTTDSWAEQHPGEVRFGSDPAQTIRSAAGNPATASAVDPWATLGSGGCVTTPAIDEPGLATYRLPAATGGGYTLLGAPTVIAKLQTADPFAQVVARLWDVAPNGQQFFVTRAAYRPDVAQPARQVFQLDPNGWQFAPGHVVKLELLGRDSPYARPSNSNFELQVSDLELRLPVRESPDGGQILGPAAPVDPPPAKGALAGRCANRIRGTAKRDRISGTNRGDTIATLAGKDVVKGRGGADCLRPGRGKDRVSGGPGRDLVIARDGRRDRIRCGRGRDRVKADRRDRVRGCERVRRP